MSETCLPWKQLMGFGLGTLRLHPSEFWNATLKELSAALEADRAFTTAAPFERAEFDRLMRAFPDK